MIKAMEDTNYTKQLEETVHQLIKMLTDPSLWNFLTDKERNQISGLLQQTK